VTPASPADAQAILLDIEGTTTPIAFVYDVLFPYVRTHLRRHLERHASLSDYQTLFDRFRDDRAVRERAGDDLPAWTDTPAAARVTSVASYVEWLMERDSKSAPLKQLQGNIWEAGYARGELVGQVFADVPAAFARWRTRGLQIGIFSSGSVLAQQLLFRHSSAGDLTGYLTWFFDPTVGPKMEADSYARIAARMDVPPPRVVFVSDVTRELDAARASGMQTLLSVRPGNRPVEVGHGHPVIRTFDEIAAE
jgi:enolase-phosphatase E1